MKQQGKFKVIVAVILMCFASISANAYDFKVDGLCYNILSKEDRTVEVTYLTSYYYYEYNKDYVKGNLEIPKKILYQSTTYTVTSISYSAFRYCSGLTSVTIPNSVTSIGNYAFYGCNGLTSVTIPNSVTSIGDYAFDDCSGLTSVTIPNSVTSIGEAAFRDCRGLTSVTIGNSVTSIGEDAFSGCRGLTSVTIGNSVTSIGYYAFRYCSGLTSVTIPNSVTSIGYGAFSGCSGLTEINVDAENQEYSSESGILYSKDKTKLITCPVGKKGEIVIPNSVTSIGSSAFQACSGLTSVTISNSVTLIGSSAFSGCRGLTSVTIPNSVTLIGSSAFNGCSGLTSVTIPNSVTSISEEAFSGCWGLTSVTIPNSVASIGGSAFVLCSGLTSVTIPNSVTSIGSSAFRYCESLKLVYCQWDEPIVCDPMFPDDVIKNAVLYVPKGCIAAYEKVDPWRNFWNIEEMEYAGVEDVAGDGVEVKVVDGAVVAEGCAEMEVYSMSGQLVYRGAGRADNLAPGIYAVRAAGKTVKVMVR